MNEFFAALKPFKDDSKNGLPADIYMIYTEEYNSKSPMTPIYTTDWLFYRPKKDGVPIPTALRLPSRLFVVCKNLKKISFDYYTQEMGQWIISLDFLLFLQQKKAFESQYELSELTIMTNKGEIITDKKYYLLRFHTYDDDLINWDESENIIADLDAGIPYDFYLNLCFKDNIAIPNFLSFSNIAFKRSFLIEESIKEELERKNFKGFALYSLKEFAVESQKRINYFRK